MDLFRLPIFDVRILGAVAVSLITVSQVTRPGAAPNAIRPRLVRGVHGVETLSFAMSPKGPLIATTNSAGGVMLRAADPGGPDGYVLDFPGRATAVAFSPDGRHLAAAGLASGIHFWEVISANKVAPIALDVPIGRARQLKFSPDGRSLAIATSLDGAIHIWDLANRRERMVLNHSSPVMSMAFSPDGRSLAATGIRNDWSIVIWNLQTGARSSLPGSGRGPVAALAFSPDGALLASTSFGERQVRIWDTATRRQRRVLSGHARSVNSVAFSPDGSLLATASNDGTLRVWAVATGRRLGTLDSQASCLRNVAFSPDGRTIVLATEDDDDIRLWDVALLL
jgi:WD40 repeat protein